MIYSTSGYSYPVAQWDGKLYYVNINNKVMVYPPLLHSRLLPYVPNRYVDNDYNILQSFLKSKIIEKILYETCKIN